MKKILFLLLASFLILGCDKDDDKEETTDLADINLYLGAWKAKKVVTGYVFDNETGVSFSQNVAPSGQKPTEFELFPLYINIGHDARITSYQEITPDTIVEISEFLLREEVGYEITTGLQQINKIEANKVEVPALNSYVCATHASFFEGVNFDIFLFVSDNSLLRILYRNLYDFEYEEIDIEGPEGEQVVSLYEVHYYTR